MKNNRFLQHFILIVALLIVSSNLRSQDLYDYSIRESLAFWSELDDPIEINDGNDFEGVINLPFNFRYDNVNVSTVYVYDNGFISLGVPFDNFGDQLPTIGINRQIISVYNSNLVIDGMVSYKIEGTAPFRVLTIEYLEAKIFTEVFGRTFDIQIKLYETSNEIQVIFGRNENLGSDLFPGTFFLSGNVGSQWINIEPEEPLEPSTFYQANINPNTTAFLDGDINELLPNGKSYTFSPNPSLSGINPDNNELYVRNNIYEDDFDMPFIRVARNATQDEISYELFIEGPLGTPDSDVIYRAVNNTTDLEQIITPNPQPIGSGAGRIVRPDHATGIAARLSDAAFDLTDPSIEGGTYQATAIIRWPASNPTNTQTLTTRFAISLENDAALTLIDLPLNTLFNPYRLEDSNVPLRVRVTNFGNEDITRLNVIARIYNNDNDNLVETIEFPNGELDISDNPIARGESRFFDLESFEPTSAGDYYVQYEVELLNALIDDNEDNNFIPQNGDPKHVFAVGYGIEAGITEMFEVDYPFYLNRPITPFGLIVNRGTTDITELDAKIIIEDPNGNVVLDYDFVIENVIAGVANPRQFFLDTLFVPTEEGEYTYRLEIYPNDPVTANDILEGTFIVQPGLAGDYTIGVSRPADYSTIQEAIDDLYLKGVVSDVNFILIDELYNVGSSLNPNDPALDFTAYFVGVNEDNTVTFTNDDRLNERGNITINFNSGSGIGMQFGQNLMPTNQNAVLYFVPNSFYNLYSKPNGYIGFDGGSSKSIVLKSNSNSSFKTIAHFIGGASNFFIENCILDGAQYNPSQSFPCELPEVFYSGRTQSEFIYDPVIEPGRVFTAGVFFRNMPPMDENKVNQYRLDTLVMKNNRIVGNDIRGFGYGIVSLGIGQLRQQGEDNFFTFLNEGNEFSHNNLYNLARAGVFLGYEYKTQVMNNRIYNIQNGSDCDAMGVAGVMLGGRYDQDALGYYNIECHVAGNEISGIQGNDNIYGIVIDQSSFSIGAVTDHFFPDMDENFSIYNNIFWGLTAGDTDANRFAIRLMTTRDTDDWQNLNSTAIDSDYFLQGSLIANNTIRIDDDRVSNEGVTAGISIQNANYVDIFSNAISLLDPVSANTPMNSMIYYEGISVFEDADKAFDADRNAYWMANTNAEMVRFTELDDDGEEIIAYPKDEFKVFEQWQQWTGLDENSVYGDWTQDYTVRGAAPYNYRINQMPRPLNSILNNRGVNIDMIEFDIDGENRGSSEERYDIGADEFTGREFGLDLEVTNIIAPAAYKTLPPNKYSEAHYVMTEAPVPVVALIRNNGRVTGNNQTITLTIDRQSELNPNDYVSSAFNTKTIDINNLYAGESLVIDFNTNSGNPSLDFVPRTYAEFGDTYGEEDIPDYLEQMISNVTPIYRITVTLSNDENVPNNEYVRFVRFFVMKSNIKLLVSTEDWDPNWNQNDDADHIAKNLNLDSLLAGFERLGFLFRIDDELSTNSIDIIDRNNWEPRSINYPIYNSLWWVDGHDMVPDGMGGMQAFELPLRDKEDMVDFLEAGSPERKTNLFIASQEMVYLTQDTDKDFTDIVFSAEVIEPINPLGENTSYSGNTVSGAGLGRENTFTIINTQYPTDQPTLARIVGIVNSGVGTPRQSYLYANHVDDDEMGGAFVPSSERGVGIINTTVSFNFAYNAVDWRHWGDVANQIRALFDFATFNNGNVVPVNLTAFDAEALGSRVDLFWTTESEQNSAYFEIEKSHLSNPENFTTINNVSAAGNSSSQINYGPFTDNAVISGETYIYRLKMVDTDGTYSYSDERTVEIGASGAFSVGDIIPNPASDAAQLSITMNDSRNVVVSLYNNLGEEVAIVNNEVLNAGTHFISLELANLPVGNYNLIIKAGSDIISKRVVVVR